MSLVAGLCVSVAATCQAITHVDVLVAYDTTAAKWTADAALDQQTFAEGQIAKANEVLKNSGLGDVFDFRLVGVHTGAFAYDGMATTLDAAIDSNDPAWAALRSDRDKAGADIVVVLVDAGVDSVQKGNSKSMMPFVNGERKYGLDFPQAAAWLQWFAPQAYGIVDIAASSSGYTFVHEIGHVMGAGHSEILSPSYSEPGPQLYSYSAAMMMQGSDGSYYATVMGYNSTGYPGSPSYTILPCFSSPDVVNPATGEALGDATHDNVLTLRNTYAKVAAFRSEVQSSDPGTTPDTPPVAPSDPYMVAVEFEAKKTTITAAVRDGDSIAGIAEFVVAATKKGESKVSGSIFGIDGKKKSVKGTKCKVYDNGDGVARVTLDGVAVKGMEGTLSVTLGSDRSLTNGSVGPLSLVSAPMGIDPSVSVAGFYIADIPNTIMGLEVVRVLPSADNPEEVKLGTRWQVAKGGRVKLMKNRDTGISELVFNGTGNFSSLKLNYQSKTSTFKGSFTAYALDGARLKQFKFNVTGVVVDGMGIGIATCRKAGITLDVFVK